MLVAVVVCLLGLGVVLTAVYRERPLPPPPAPSVDWEPLPTIAEVSRTDFPLAFPGYDPATVEAHLDALRRAYADLLAVAPPEVVHRARRRAAIRTGGDPDALVLRDPAGPFAGADGIDAPAEDEAMRIEAIATRLNPDGEPAGLLGSPPPAVPDVPAAPAAEPPAAIVRDQQRHGGRAT